jgi:hypothetical protein
MSIVLFFGLYCLEAGFFFTVLPWTRIWTYNPLLHSTLAVGMWADNPFVRGFVSGVGVVHLIVGSRELVSWSRARRGTGVS